MTAATLERKGIDYRRIDLMPVISKAALRGCASRVTVPALRIDGQRVQGSREIARELDRIVPEPPLYPSDPDRRRAVEDAERFGDEELQAPARRILWNAPRRDRSPLRSFSAGARLGIPIDLAIKTAALIVAASARFNDATDANVRADLAALPRMLDRIDAWIADGVLGGPEAERGRPSDRHQPAAADDDGRHPGRDRAPACRPARDRRRPRIPWARRPDPAAGVARGDRARGRPQLAR